MEEKMEVEKTSEIAVKDIDVIDKITNLEAIVKSTNDRHSYYLLTTMYPDKFP